MKIIYDNFYEISNVIIRCNNTENKNKCHYCALFDCCNHDIENYVLPIRCAIIRNAEGKNNGNKDTDCN